MTRRRHGDGRDNQEHTLSFRAPDTAQRHFDGAQQGRGPWLCSVLCGFLDPGSAQQRGTLQRVRDTRDGHK